MIDRGRRFIFAYTNEEVRRLNDAIQAVEIERGRVRNVESFETKRGTLRIGEGDRIVYRSTDKARGIVNGLFATVQSIEGSKLVARTDRGRSITFDLLSDATVDLGYAGTIYRGQGKTLDEVYLLHTRHWRDAASYVGFTRARRSTRVFVSKDQARNLDQLAMQISRQSHRGTTLGFAQKSQATFWKFPLKKKSKYTSTSTTSKMTDKPSENLSSSDPAVGRRARRDSNSQCSILFLFQILNSISSEGQVEGQEGSDAGCVERSNLALTLHSA
jgi:hypothetical protein